MYRNEVRGSVLLHLGLVGGGPQCPNHEAHPQNATSNRRSQACRKLWHRSWASEQGWKTWHGKSIRRYCFCNCFFSQSSILQCYRTSSARGGNTAKSRNQQRSSMHSDTRWSNLLMRYDSNLHTGSLQGLRGNLCPCTELWHLQEDVRSTSKFAAGDGIPTYLTCRLHE